MQHASTPDPAGERIAVVDTLRAVALFGIIITHCLQGYFASRPPRLDFMTFTALDGIVATLGILFAVGKFFTIFSFLFGLSFALQLQSAARKGAAFAGRFVWRLTVLALIALVHTLFYAGDILVIYAVLGVLLIPLRNVNTRALVVVALLLILNVPGLVMGWRALSAPPPTAEQAQAAAQAREELLQAAQYKFELKKSGPVVEIMRTNFYDGLVGKLEFQIRTGRLWMTFGLFLLGLCAGRLQIFRDTEEHRAFFRRLLWGAGVVAAVTTAIAVFNRPVPQITSIGELAASFSRSVQWASLSAFYVSVITLLYWRKPTQGLLPALAPVGRMGLTVYLTQTVFGVCLFHSFGLGLLGEIGTAPAVALGILFYVVQILLARWWMSHYSLGPVEWLWRSLTYFKLQPNSRALAKPA